YKQLPDDCFDRRDTPFGDYLKHALRHGFFRAEYLMWNVNGPNNQLLGEQTLSGVSANSQLSNFGQLPSNVSGPATIPLGPNVFFPNTVDGVTGVSESPTLASFSINAMSGFRATYGVPLPSGQFEYSAFIFQTRRGGFPTADVNVPGSLIQPQIISN